MNCDCIKGRTRKYFAQILSVSVRHRANQSIMKCELIKEKILNRIG